MKRQQPIEKPARQNTEFNYANIGDWLNHCSSPCEVPPHLRLSRLPRANNWHGTSSFEESLKLARTGWLEGAQMAREMVAQINAVSRSKSYSRVFAPNRVGGGTLLMGRYLQNLPECYLKQKKQLTNRFVTMVINATASAGVETEVLINRGATAAAVIDALEQQRIRVRVVMVFSWTGIRDQNRTWTWRIQLKDFNESVDIDRLAFFLANPSSLRRLNFSAMELVSRRDRCDLKTGEGHGGYGRPRDIDSDRGDIYFSRAYFHDPQWLSVEGCVRFLKETLAAQGVEV